MMQVDGLDKADRLWVPLLTQYRQAGGRVAVDGAAMAAHVHAIRPSVRQFLLAGSTGDGWELGAAQLLELAAASRQEAFSGTCLLFGALGPKTADVIAFARALEDSFERDGGPAGDYVGLAICPPIDAEASQDDILAHYRAVLAATTSDVAVYQLPQVTKCAIAPNTMRVLADEPRVTMFKDTSGTDSIAQSGVVSRITLVRGAEGGYADALKPTGPYDGWLLSTGNAFGPLLRRMLVLHETGELERAGHLSKVLTAIIEALFAAASRVPFGNPFSNANRAALHILTEGANWRSAPSPLTVGGQTLPVDLLEAVDDIIGHVSRLPERRRGS